MMPRTLTKTIVTMHSTPEPTGSAGGTSVQMRAEQSTTVRSSGRGSLITFEGPDGSGKTTQLALLAQRLRRSGLPVVTLRQPGGTPFGDRLRTLLVDSATDASMGLLAPLTELGLMFADRAQAIAQVIEPALAAGQIVLCDRFTDSTEAYQGGGRELGSEPVLALHALLCSNLQPNLTLLLLPPLARSLDRARTRNAEREARDGVDEGRFEREPEAFYRRVYTAYEAIAEREPARVVSIRDDASIDAIEARINAVVDRFLAGLVLTS